MKKLLLSCAVITAAFSASAETIVDATQSFAGMTEFPFYVMEYKPDIVDGVLTATAPLDDDGKPKWYQFFVMSSLTLEKDVEYTVTAKIRGSKGGQLNVQLGDWGALQENTLVFTDQWSEASVLMPPVTVDKGFVVFQPGAYDGKLEIEWVKLTHDGTPRVIPTTGDIVASFYTGNDKTFGGWGGSATFENVEEDGKPCLKFTNPEASENSWSIQMCISQELETGKTYYLGFDIKGNPATGLPVSFQHADGYKGKGSMTKYDITEDWKHVIVYGTPVSEDPEERADRILFDLGKYQGTFYMTNVTLYTESNGGSNGIEAPAVDEPARLTVHNLQGIVVLDTNDRSMISSLKPGLYIVNGKKTLIR